jgi:hypothetical protein
MMTFNHKFEHVTDIFRMHIQQIVKKICLNKMFTVVYEFTPS